MPELQQEFVLHGLTLSYFTGKLEAYMRAKGLPYRFVEMDTADFRACAKATGIAQMPQLEMPDGTWLTDTTAIIRSFEKAYPEPRLHPVAPVPHFLSLLLEDLFDEWYWRPALYYRWAFDEDMQLMSSQIARTLLRDMPLPFFVRKQFILRRQRRVFLKQDGVTRATKPHIEALYLNALKALEPVFAKRPFLLGDHPCEADFGLMGPFFRHFFSDPTPAWIMRRDAPNVANWVTRMWALSPKKLSAARAVETVPVELGHFFHVTATEYLPYLAANAAAYAEGKSILTYSAAGVDWRLPVAPYRVQCFNDLKQQYGKLTASEKRIVGEHLGESASAQLGQASTPFEIDRAKPIKDRLLR